MKYSEGIEVDFLHDGVGSLSSGICTISSGYSLPPHHHKEDEIYIITGGYGTLTVDGKSELLMIGDSRFIPGGAVHSMTASSRDVRLSFVFPTHKWEDVEYIWRS